MPVEESMVPQLGLQEAPKGVAVPHEPLVTKEGNELQICVLDPTTGCITAQLRPRGGPLARLAVNWICWAGFKPTGAVAEFGVTAMRMPVSMLSVAVPFLLLLASAAAVKVRMGMGFGNFEREGAV